MPGYFQGLMDPMQLQQSVSNAFTSGQQMRRQYETEAALGAYAQDMSAQNAAAVTRHDPRLGIQLMDRERQRQEAEQKAQQEEQERQIIGAALTGDPQARQQLAYFNSELYLKLDANQKKGVDDLYGAIAQQAFSILQRPEQEHAALVQQALQGLAQQGVDTSQFRQTGDATQDLKLALAMAGQLDEWEQFSQPKYLQRGEGGLQGFQFGVPIQGGPAVGGPQPGVIEDGYQFIGGDPADPNSWTPVGGGGGNATGGF
jgi:hypothetical protein